MKMPGIPKVVWDYLDVIFAVGIIIVFAMGVLNWIMIMFISQQMQNAVIVLYNDINKSNDTFQADTNGHLLYLQNEVYEVQQQGNVSSQADLQDINSLKESDVKLQGQLATDEIKIANLAASMDNLTLNYTNTIQVIYLNTSTTANTTTAVNYSRNVPPWLQFQYNYPCTQTIVSNYALGTYTCIRADCNRNVGWQEDACDCWGSYNTSDLYRC